MNDVEKFLERVEDKLKLRHIDAILVCEQLPRLLRLVKKYREALVLLTSCEHREIAYEALYHFSGLENDGFDLGCDEG